jgi:SAM-dependent methyltransferase
VSGLSDYTYVGSELGLFARARTWKAYAAGCLREHLGDEVLEVGAGIGGTTQFCCRGSHRRWLCLEPDATMAAEIQSAIAAGALPACCQVSAATLDQLEPGERFDSILYFDVLEHIADDRAELARAATHLKPAGNLIVLGPAHQWLYSPFDQAIGHFRRYSKRTLSAVVPAGLTCNRLDYLDSVGLLALMGNRFLLRRRLPWRGQVWMWDRLMVPVSCLLDPLLRHRVGKSVLGIWQRSP